MEKHLFPQHERPAPFLIIVTGLPATGKSTLARYLAQELQLPLLYKDGIKERLFDALGWRDRHWSQKLSMATYALLYDMLELHLQAKTSLILESNFTPSRDNKRFHDLFRRYEVFPYQILCYANGDILWQRFKKRIGSPERHPGHIEASALPEFEPIIRQGYQQPLDLKGPLLELDTTTYPSPTTYHTIVEQLLASYNEHLATC
jgi:predicted kinase